MDLVNLVRVVWDLIGLFCFYFALVRSSLFVLDIVIVIEQKHSIYRTRKLGVHDP